MMEVIERGIEDLIVFTSHVMDHVRRHSASNALLSARFGAIFALITSATETGRRYDTD